MRILMKSKRQNRSTQLFQIWLRSFSMFFTSFPRRRESRSVVARFVASRLCGNEPKGMIPILRRGAFISSILFLSVTLNGIIHAQDYTHPTKMNLPESAFQRPAPQKFQVKLPNGLTAYIAENRGTGLATITAFVRAGLASDNKQGAAEILARALKNNGPSSMAAEAFHAKLREMVADFRIEVSHERTEISLNVGVEDVEPASSLFAALLSSPEISQEDISSAQKAAASQESRSAAATGESGPVLYEGSLDVAVAELDRRLLADHPFGYEPAAKDYAALKAADVENFHQKYFNASNIVLAVSGDFERAEAVAIVEKTFSDLPRGNAVKAKKIPAAKSVSGRSIHTFNSDKLQGWLAMGHALPVISRKDQVALEVMNYILAGGHFAVRMWLEMRDKRGLTNTVGGYPEFFKGGGGTYTFRTYGRPEVIGQLVEIMLREIEKIQTSPVSDEELMIAKNAWVDGRFQMRFEDGEKTARTFALEWLDFGNHENTEKFPAMVRAVSAADVQRVAKKYLKPEHFQMTLVGPIEKIVERGKMKGGESLTSFGEVIRAQ